MGWGALGGIIGSIIGILGGVIGTLVSIKNTRSDRERNYVIKVALILWIWLSAFLILLLLLPLPYKWLLWIPYMIFLPIFVRKVNKQQTRIREEEGS